MDGQWHTFSVTVRYRLSSVGQGELSVGFNNGDASDVFEMATSQNLIMEKGTGEHTFSVRAMAKNLGGVTPFQVIVTLSEYPHASSWKSLDSDKGNLHF